MSRIATIEGIIIEAEERIDKIDTWNAPNTKVEAYEAIREFLFPGEYPAPDLYPCHLSLPNPEEEFNDHCHCNRGIRTTPNKTKYCPVHGYDYQSSTSSVRKQE